MKNIWDKRHSFTSFPSGKRAREKWKFTKKKKNVSQLFRERGASTGCRMMK